MKRLLPLCLFLAAGSACTEKATPPAKNPVPTKTPAPAKAPVAVPLPAPIQGQDYRLVFEDTFDGPAGAKADPARWSDWAPGPRKKAFNVADACHLDGQGHLVIEVRRGTDGRTETGGIQSARQFQATHGYYECRCKVLEQPGAWSAFWLQSPSIGRPLGNARTAGVEIDVFEYFPHAWKKGGSRKDLVEHNAHWDGYAKANHKTDHAEHVVPGLAKDFRTFAVKWDEAGYVFFVDGVETGRWTKAPVSDRPEYLILSCEANSWTGDIAKAELPAAFLVDHVRVWQTPAQQAADKARKEAEEKARAKAAPAQP